MIKVPRGKWYCHSCVSKAPPPKKRAPRKSTPKESSKDQKDTKESKDVKDSKESAKEIKEKNNISNISAPSTPRAATPQPIVCADAASTPIGTSNNATNDDPPVPSR